MEEEKIQMAFKAIENNDIPTLKLLLDSGLNSNVEYEAKTMLHVAAEHNNLEAARILLEKKETNIEAKDGLGRTPLYITAMYGSNDVMTELINKDANIEAAEMIRQKKPLHAATENNNIEAVILLLQKGANVNAQDEYGNTSMHFAAENGSMNIATILLQSNAEADKKDNIGYTPMHNAALYGNTDIVTLLVDNGADINAKSCSNTTPLHLAYRHKNMNTVETLLKKGADPEIQDINGETLPHHAIQRRHENMSREMVVAGTNKRAPSKQNQEGLALLQELDSEISSASRQRGRGCSVC